MRFFRWMACWAGMGLGLILLVPALALLPAALCDRGPGGDLRPTLFPMALAVLDPFVWDCARNSLTVAAVVASGSLILGIILARILVGRRFWGRRPLGVLALAPMAVPPVCGALGLRVLFGGGGGLEVGATSAWGREWGWVAWVWVGLSSGVPLVALELATVLAHVEPAWEDAARLVGAGRFRTWWQLIWPVVRPVAARATAAVFSLTLVEPGAPLLLGLRRTLAFQVVEAALGPAPFPRAAVLALMALAIAVVGRTLVLWWGRPPVPIVPAISGARAESASWPRAAGLGLVLVLWTVLAWVPVLPVLGLALAPAEGHSVEGAYPSLGAFLHRLADPLARRLIFNSAALGVAVVALDSVVAWALTGRRRGVLAALAAWPEALPPLTLGVGALVLPWLLHLGAEGLRAIGSMDTLIRVLESLADLLDPYRTPGVLLVLAVASVHLPGVVRGWEAGRARVRSHRARIDAALQLGATARPAAAADRFVAAPGALVLTFALAASNLAPALVVAPTIECRTITPGALILADGPGDGRQLAAALAAAVIVIRLMALALAARDRDGSVHPDDRTAATDLGPMACPRM